MDLKNAIKEISTLKLNWNENGALPFEQELLDKCNNIIDLLPKDNKFECYPTAANSIQFEYGKNHNTYLEFNVYKNVIALFIINNGKETETYVVSIPNLIEAINNFIKED